jgi:hypothetical protein
MEFSLPAKPPFNLTAVMRSHGWMRLAPFRELDEGAGMAYIARLASGNVIEVFIRPAEQGVAVAIDADLSLAEQQEIAGCVDWMLGLEQDFSEFYAMIRQEPKLARAVERAQGRV